MPDIILNSRGLMSSKTMRRAIRLFKFKFKLLEGLSTTKHPAPMSNEPSHISKLPPELLAIIFEIGDLLSYQSGSERISTYPLIISSVCCLWRNVALNITPTMWSTIVIHPNRTLDIPLLFLSRSGNMLLDITVCPHIINSTINIEPAGIPNCFDLILQFSHRWRYLKLDRCEFPNISDILYSVRAPYLTKLILNGRYGDHVSPMFIDDGAPMLSHVSLYGMAKCCGQPTRFLSIQTLRLSLCGYDMDNAEFSSFLESFPTLQRLILRSSGSKTMTASGLKPVTLPNLVELTSIQGSDGLEFGFGLGFLALYLEAPLLRVVNLSVIDEMGWGWFLFWESFESYPKPLPSVEKLTISGTINRVFQKVPIIFPDVRDLDLSQTVANSGLAMENVGFEQARYWPSLENLIIRGWSSKSDDRYLINFVKGLLEWHGRRIQKIKILVDDDRFNAVQLKGAFKELEVPLDILYGKH